MKMKVLISVQKYYDQLQSFQLKIKKWTVELQNLVDF